MNAKLLVIMLLSMITVSANANRNNGEIFMSSHEKITEAFHKGVVDDVKHRNDKLRVLDAKQMLLSDTEQFWTDGRFIFSTFYDPDSRVIEAGFNRFMEPTAAMVKPHEMVVVGNKVKVKGAQSLTVTVEKLGQYTMLVYRDAKGAPARAYYHIDVDASNNGLWTIFVHYILAGNYKLVNGENAVFGERQAFYDGDEFNCDPGVYQFYIYPNKPLIDILYGEGRVSHGDPSSPKYGKMPGGGGAGALMGPMVWQVKFTQAGLDAVVTEDQRFVDHRPRLAQGNNVLTKVQCPWQGVDGKWAFASVIPLTHELLKLFPKDVLELMRAEIYARHGDTFKSAHNQRYFDQQPWYKKSGKRVVLSDIERFNVALIKQVMATY